MASKHKLSQLLTSLPVSKKLKPTDSTAISNQVDTDIEITQFISKDNEYENKGYVHGPLDPTFGQRGAFPVSIDLRDVDPNKKPETAAEYLAQVRLQACGINYDDDDDFDSDDDFVYYKAPVVEAKEDNFIVELDQLQSYVEEYKLGRKQYEEYRMNLEELNAIDLPPTAKDWKKFIWEVSCERDYIAQVIEEEEHVKLLVYFTKWMSLKVDDNFQEWLFGMLEAIEEVLSSSEISVLRQLGKKVLRQYEQRIKLGQTENLEVYAKVLAIIGIFYKQKDLISK